MCNIVLASSSPRRKELLSKFNIDIEIIKSEIIEKIKENESPYEIAMSLALQKAIDVASDIKEEKIVIAADTIVVYGDNILGKPNSKEEAFNMIKMLSGNKHSVITGLCILKANSDLKIVDYVETKVIFRNLSQDKINNYLDTNEYEDKAGAYGIQGFGSVLVKSFEGSYTNIVGLPVERVDELLEEHFNLQLL